MSFRIMVASILILSSLPCKGFAQSGGSWTAVTTGFASTGGAQAREAELRLRSTFTYGSGSFRLRWDGSLVQLLSTDSPRSHLAVRGLGVEWSGGSTDMSLGILRTDVGRSATGPIAGRFSRSDLRIVNLSDPEDAQLGIPGVRIVHYRGQNYVEGLLTGLPFPSMLPDETSRWGVLPELDGVIVSRRAPQREWSLRESQAMLRLALRSIRHHEVDLVAAHWSGLFPTFSAVLSADPERGVLHLDATEWYPARWTLGLSYSFSAVPGLVATVENLYVHAAPFSGLPMQKQEFLAALTDPQQLASVLAQFRATPDGVLREAPQSVHYAEVRGSLGDWTISADATLDLVHGSMAGMIRGRVFTTLGLGVDGRFLQDRWALRGAASWHPQASDGLWLASLDHLGWDRHGVSIGGQWFSGTVPDDPLYGHLSYARYRSNSQMFLRWRWYL